MSAQQTRAGPPGQQAPSRQLRPGPLAGVYPAAAAMVVLFLVPYLGLSSALSPLEPLISAQLHMSLQTLSLASGMANAAYALGTVLAVQFALLLPQRRMLLVYGSLLVIGSVLAAAATGPGMFIAGHVLQGLCTSMLLVAAAPPLFLGFPVAKLRITAVIMNLCVFGAVAAGPLGAGVVPGLAAAVLDRGRHRGGGSADVAADVPGRPARRPQRPEGSRRHRAGRPLVRWRRSGVPRSCLPTGSATPWRSCPWSSGWR